MPDLILLLQQGVTHDSVCQVPPHQRTRQNPVNHQHRDLLRIIGLKEKYALPVCVVFHSKKTLPSLKDKPGPAYDGGVGSREIAANVPEAAIQLDSLVLLGSTKRISIRPLVNETSLKTALRATCCFSGTVYRHSAETRSGSCWHTKRPPKPARMYLSRKPRIASLSLGISRSNPGGLSGLNSSRRTTLMSCPSTTSSTVPIAKSPGLRNWR